MTSEIAKAKKRSRVGVRADRKDGGYGWTIVFGCWLIHFLLGGYCKSYGLIYIRVRERFHDSAAVTAWIGGAQVAMRMGFSPLANALARKYGTRAVVISGAIILTLGSILNGFMVSSFSLLVTYTLISGFGSSLSYAPTLVLVSEYFQRKRGVAMSLCTCGSGAGAFVFPAAMITTFEWYGFLPGLTVVGAFMGHSLVAGVLMKPFQMGNVSDVKSIEMEVEIAEDVEDIPPTTSVTASYPDKFPAKTENVKVVEGEQINVKVSDEVKEDNKKQIEINNATNKSSEQYKNRKSNTIDSCNGMFYSLYEMCKTFVESFCLFFDISLWKDPIFSIFSASQALSVCSYIPLSMLTPAFGAEKGLTALQSSTLLSVLAAGDTVGRLFSGFLFDWKVLSTRRWLPYGVALAVNAALVANWTLITWYPAWLVNAGINGITIGVSVSQRTNTLCDMMNNKRISSAVGMLIFTQGAALLFGPYLAGFARDVFGTYDASYRLLAFNQSMSAVLFWVTTLLTWRREKLGQ